MKRFGYCMALALVIVATIGVAVQSQTLPSWPPVVAPVGASQTYLLTHFAESQVLDRQGIFLLQSNDSLEQRVARAIEITYTVLESDIDGVVRLHVSGQPVHPETVRPLVFPSWEGVYRLEPEGPVLESEMPPVREYADLIEPKWLYWGPMATDVADNDEIAPSDTWDLAVQAIEDPFMPDDQRTQSTGRFVAWETVDGSQVAVVEQYVDSVASSATEDDIHLEIEESLRGAFQLLPDGFPLEGHWLHESVLGVFVSDGNDSELPGSLQRKVRTEVRLVRHDTNTARSVHRLEAGQIIDNRLELLSWDLGDGSQAAVYMFDGAAQEHIAIALESHEFDPYLLLLDEDWNVLSEGDAQEGDARVLLEYVLPYAGTYYIVANTYITDQVGLFTLALQSLGRQVDELALRQTLQAALRSIDEAVALGEWQEVVELLEVTATNTRLQLPFAIREAHLLAERPSAYGEYVSRASRVYRSNESILVYLEPENFHMRHDGERHEIHFTIDATLFGSTGEAVLELLDVAVWNRLTLRPIRDVYITVPLWVPDLQDGHYILRMTVHDAISGQAATTDLPIVISNPGIAVLP